MNIDNPVRSEFNGFITSNRLHHCNRELKNTVVRYTVEPTAADYVSGGMIEGILAQRLVQRKCFKYIIILFENVFPSFAAALGPCCRLATFDLLYNVLL